MDLWTFKVDEDDDDDELILNSGTGTQDTGLQKLLLLLMTLLSVFRFALENHRKSTHFDQ